MTNNKNNDEIKSTHPEAVEDIKVSDSVPNSYKELLELQKPKIVSIDDLADSIEAIGKPKDTREQKIAQRLAYEEWQQSQRLAS